MPSERHRAKNSSRWDESGNTPRIAVSEPAHTTRSSPNAPRARADRWPATLSSIRRPVAGHAPGGRAWPDDAASMTITATSSGVGQTSAGVGEAGSRPAAGSSGDFDRAATRVPSQWDSTHLDGRRCPAVRSSPVAGEVAQAGAERPRHCRRRWAYRVPLLPLLSRPGSLGLSCQRSRGCSHGVGRPWPLVVRRRPHRGSPGVGGVRSPECRYCV
jgi:hypothetical protein